MKIETIKYSKASGWSAKNFPKLDPENTLILLLAAPEFINDTQPINDLVKSWG